MNTNSTKLALVTGSSRRLGRCLSLALANDNWDVALHSHEESKELSTLENTIVEMGRGCQVFIGDLGQSEFASLLPGLVEEKLGPLTLLVNNAAVLLSSGIDTDSVEDFDRTMNLNLRAPYLLSLEAGRRMMSRGEGQIINISSTGGQRPYLKHIPYSLSKGALNMLTLALAQAFAPQLRCNAIAPGVLNFEGETESALRPRADKLPAGCYGSGEQVAEAMLFLCRSAHINGEILKVDGGYHLK